MQGNAAQPIPELLAPGGTLSKARVALAYGADAVYAGAAGLSMRPDDASLSADELRRLAAEAHGKGKRLYVAVNTLMLESDLSPLDRWIEETSDIPFDAVIVSDPGALTTLRDARPDVRLHISTQASTANARAAAFWRQAGARRVVLARECTLRDATAIAENPQIETEIFVHGAMCVAVSGRCLLSAHLCGSAASRGECKHSCRWEWQLVEAKRPGESIPVFETGKQTIFLGSTDLCLIEHIPELVQSGVSSLKIEGRMKSEHHVASVTRSYRAALDAYGADPESYRCAPAWLHGVQAVSHRPYSTGFAFGYPEDAPDTMQTHTRPQGSHQILGIVEDTEGAELVVNAKYPFRVGETVEWIAPGQAEGTVEILAIVGEEGEDREGAHCGTRVRVSVSRSEGLPVLSILRRPARRKT